MPPHVKKDSSATAVDCSQMSMEGICRHLHLTDRKVPATPGLDFAGFDCCPARMLSLLAANCYTMFLVGSGPMNDLTKNKAKYDVSTLVLEP